MYGLYTSIVHVHGCAFYVLRNILCANIDKIAIPSVEELIGLSHLAEEYMSENKELVEIFGPIEQSMLWKATRLEGEAHNIYLSPPVDNCVLCGSTLQAHHVPTTVICYTWLGPLPASKLTLRCEQCSINYRYEQYGDSKNGYRYYDEPRPFVHCSQVAYMDRMCCAHMGSAA